MGPGRLCTVRYRTRIRGTMSLTRWHVVSVPLTNKRAKDMVVAVRLSLGADSVRQVRVTGSNLRRRQTLRKRDVIEVRRTNLVEAASRSIE
jgi:hypothetical protein